MSLWYLTSSEDADRKARDICERAGLRPSGELSKTNCKGRAYFKRVIATQNIAKYTEGAWILSAGTIIYDGKLGEEALQKCYSAFLSKGISAVQSKALGHYALATCRDDEVTIFTDPDGALSLYYVTTGSLWFVSNSLHVCASVLPHRELDSTKLLITAIQTALPGEDTFYSGIKRLFGVQSIRISLAGGTFRTEITPQPSSYLSCHQLSMADAIEQYKEEVRSVFREISAVGSIGLFGTGGMDSRTILAALVDQKAPLQMMYGMGNSNITDSALGDLEVARSVAELYDVPFRQLDWSGNQPYSDEKLRQAFRMYGFQAEIYGASESFLRSLYKGISPYPRLLLGGYSPAFLFDKPWDLKRVRTSKADLLSDSMHSQGVSIDENQCIADKATYKSVCAAEVEIALRYAGIEYPSTGASLELYVKARLALYLRQGSRYLNFVNEFTNYIAPFLMMRLCAPLMSVPLEYRTNEEFRIRLIHSLAPALLEVPLHSGGGPKEGAARIDRDTFQMVRTRSEQKTPGAHQFAKQAIPPILREPLRRLYFRLMPWETFSAQSLMFRDVEIKKLYGRHVMDDPLGRKWFGATTDFSPKDISRIWQYMVGVNTLGYSG